MKSNPFGSAQPIDLIFCDNTDSSGSSGSCGSIGSSGSRDSYPHLLTNSLSHLSYGYFRVFFANLAVTQSSRNGQIQSN